MTVTKCIIPSLCVCRSLVVVFSVVAVIWLCSGRFVSSACLCREMDETCVTVQWGQRTIKRLTATQKSAECSTTRTHLSIYLSNEASGSASPAAVSRRQLVAQAIKWHLYWSQPKKWHRCREWRHIKEHRQQQTNITSCVNGHSRSHRDVFSHPWETTANNSTNKNIFSIEMNENRLSRQLRRIHKPTQLVGNF